MFILLKGRALDFIGKSSEEMAKSQMMISSDRAAEQTNTKILKHQSKLLEDSDEDDEQNEPSPTKKKETSIKECWKDKKADLSIQINKLKN